MKSLHSAICLIFISLIFHSAFSAPVSKTSALSVAQNFLARVGDTDNLKSGVRPGFVYVEYDKLQNSSEMPSEQPFFYIFNSDHSGFVIVAGDDGVQPVLAYSGESKFDADLIPAGMEALLRDYAAGIDYIRKNNLPPSPEVKEKWAQYLHADGRLKASPVTEALKPLTTTKWGYGKPYNDLCPAEPKAVGTNGGHCAAGCAAVAMAQLMKYWNWPDTACRQNMYYAWEYNWLGVNFDTISYEWNNMPDAVDEHTPTHRKNAVATLIYHCGVSVDMTYGPGKSECYFEIDNVNRPGFNCVETAFSKYFRYKNSIRSIKKSFPDSTWKAIIKKEISAGRPVVYDGYDVTLKASHTYVIDGFDNSDHFHVNWGVYGNYNDAYFDINLMGFEGYNFTGGDPRNVGMPCILTGIEPDYTRRDIKLCPAENLMLSESVRIWPNPATDRLNVVFDCMVDDFEDVEILNSMGVRILSVPYSCTTLQIPLENMTDGIYFLRFRNRKNPVTKKFIIQK